MSCLDWYLNREAPLAVSELFSLSQFRHQFLVSQFDLTRHVSLGSQRSKKPSIFWDMTHLAMIWPSRAVAVLQPGFALGHCGKDIWSQLLLVARQMGEEWKEDEGPVPCSLHISHHSHLSILSDCLRSLL